MNTTYNTLSLNKKRQEWYAKFLMQCAQDQSTIDDIIQLGAKVMRKSKLHHHFFGDYTWRSQSKALVDYAFKKWGMDNDNLQNKISEKTALECIVLFEKRIEQKIPVEYITHEAEYLGRSFYVNEHVLVPRSIMNTRFSDFLKAAHWENNRVLDLCAGSGCIGITLALMAPHIRVDLADISAEALAVAQMNINRYRLNDRVQCIQSDVFDQISGKYDLIITNPPYVSEREYQQSPDEFKNEPKIALASGKEGLDVVHRIMSQAKVHLNTQGHLIAEVGYTAAKRIKKQYPDVKLQWFKYRRPSGKESFLGDHGVFVCEQKHLLATDAHNRKKESWMWHTLWKIKNTFLFFLKQKTMGARALVISGDQVLLVKHSYMPKWYTVGGGIDKSETPVEAVRRELWEEVGIQCVEAPKLFGVYHNGFEKRDDFVVLYIVTKFIQIPMKSPEILDAQWFSVHALPEEISPATQRRIEEYLGERLPDERW